MPLHSNLHPATYISLSLMIRPRAYVSKTSTGVSPGNGDCFIGFDLGTSGARMSIVERRLSDSEDKLWDYVEVATEALAWDDNMQYDKGNDWRAALDTLLKRVRSTEVMTRVNAICVSGTSATCLLVDRSSLEVSRDARMYSYDISSSSNESAKKRVMELVDKYIPEKHTARATTGSLCKLLLWNEEQSVVDDTGEVKEVLCHQSDFAAVSLMQEPGMENSDLAYQFTSDWHNVLKLGFDVRAKEFPPWMMKLLQEGAGITNPENVLPSKVISPGEPYGVISSTVATKYGLSPNCLLVGGTTDSNAAFFAAAGAKPDYGTAVTSLGSTLAMKQLSEVSFWMLVNHVLLPVAIPEEYNTLTIDCVITHLFLCLDICGRCIQGSIQPSVPKIWR